VVHDEEVHTTLPSLAPIWRITASRPRADFVRTRELLARFAGLFRQALHDIRRVHGPGVQVHLFPAVPNSVAVECGKVRLPEADPAIRVYDSNRGGQGWRFALDLLTPLGPREAGVRDTQPTSLPSTGTISFIRLVSIQGSGPYKGNVIAEAVASQLIAQHLSAWLGEPAQVEVARMTGGWREIDLTVHIRGVTFFAEFKASDALAGLESAHRQLAVYAQGQQCVPLLVVPYMGPKAREFARSVNLPWMDLSGNADIRGPGLRILIEGQPHRFAAPGRPSTTFSDRAARLSRAMLVEPERWWPQRELASAVGISTGYVSKVVARLLEDELVEQGPTGGLRPRSPGLLLDAWAQTYTFRRHQVARYQTVGRTGPTVAEALGGRLAAIPGLTSAATGLTAAWAWTHFADHRLVTFFVSRPLLEPEAVGLRPVSQGENVWLVVPRDEGVFYGAETIFGLRCVHPVQTWLDLSGHPERSKEAAEHLRAQRLAWRSR
jgi:hypothetical protein